MERRGGRERGSRYGITVLTALLLLAAAALFHPGQAVAPVLALSEIGSDTSEGGTLPDPAETEEFPPLLGMDPDGPLPAVIYNLDRLPEPVRRMHRRIVEATRSGDIERLRPLIGGTQLSFGGLDQDPIEFLKGNSEGHEILAILEEVLSAGFVHLGAGTPGELYVWPYFFAIPLDHLTDPQLVELFKIITAGDYQEMEAFGSYIFYRVGIQPDGNWSFFVAGD